MAKKQPKKTVLENTQPKRKVGRPRKGESPVTPEKIEQVNDMFLQRYTVRETAAKTGLTSSTVQNIIRDVLRPMWKESICSDVSEELKRIEQIEMAGWKRYKDTEDPADLANAKWAAEQRAKIHGHYAPTKLDLDIHSDRVAGRDLDEFTAETARMIVEKLAEQVQYAQARRVIEGVVEAT